jgi:hypothetical protein
VCTWLSFTGWPLDIVNDPMVLILPLIFKLHLWGMISSFFLVGSILCGMNGEVDAITNDYYLFIGNASFRLK